MRTVFGSDGCHLKDLEMGQIQILCTIDRYANNGMFPIMIKWVEDETRDSHKWLLEFLNKEIGFGPYSSDMGWMIPSDRKKAYLSLKSECTFVNILSKYIICIYCWIWAYHLLIMLLLNSPNIWSVAKCSLKSRYFCCTSSYSLL